MTRRIVTPEWLDQLSPDDPGAIASRRDLRRLNFWMGHAQTIQRALAGLRGAGLPFRIAELGAGDGTLFLRVARALGKSWVGANICLVDRRPSISAATQAALREIGWKVDVAKADIFDWLPAQDPLDIVVANLFLHHFENESLTRLLSLISQRSRALVACEPRRCMAGRAVSGMLRLLGCHAVTRHDAPISVRAGFRGKDLSNAWWASPWKLREERSGLFSHLFVARKESR